MLGTADLRDLNLHLMKLYSFEIVSYILVWRLFYFALLLFVGYHEGYWDEEYPGDLTSHVQDFAVFKGLSHNLTNAYYFWNEKDYGEHVTQLHLWTGDKCRTQWIPQTERVSVYPSSRRLNWVLKNSGKLLIGDKADIAAGELKISFPENWGSFLFFPFSFLTCLMN